MAEKTCKNCKWGTLSSYGHTVYECFCNPERVFKSVTANTPLCKLWEPERNYVMIPDGKAIAILPIKSIVDLSIENDTNGIFKSLTVCTCTKELSVLDVIDANIILTFFDIDYEIPDL